MQFPGLVASSFSVAIPAEHLSAFPWLERDFTFFLAFSANGFVHFPRPEVSPETPAFVTVSHTIFLQILAFKHIRNLTRNPPMPIASRISLVYIVCYARNGNTLLPGFEPGSRPREGRMIGRTTLQEHAFLGDNQVVFKSFYQKQYRSIW